MSADIKAELTKRFTDAIRKSFKPCPLVGEKWFKLAGGEPPVFQFAGVNKLAKATGKKPDFVAKTLTRNLDLKGLAVAVSVTVEHEIHLKLTQVGSPKA